jgi:hypothetical protein
MSDYTDTTISTDTARLELLSADLGSRNGIERRHAREALERVGREATPYLLERLGSPDANARWEAAKALGNIADPAAGPALVRALMDESFEVQWLAAEALIILGKDAIEPLLDGLIHNYGSVFMRQGAHHVLHDLERKHLLSPLTLRVLDELRCMEPLEPFPVSARRALKELSEDSNSSRLQGDE